MHKKYTRVRGSLTQYRVENCGCLIGAAHNDMGVKVNISASVGAIVSITSTGARLTELQAEVAKETA